MIVKFLAAALMTLVLSCPAAATVLYKITVTGGYDFSITVPESPAAVSDFIYGPSGFGFSDVSGVFEGVDTSMYVTFLVDDDGVAVRELDQTPVWQGFSEANGRCSRDRHLIRRLSWVAIRWSGRPSDRVARATRS
jgi:hypothetical protein